MSNLKSKCNGYMGDVCTNGSCPMWQHRVTSCDDCHFHRGCNDCYFYKDNRCITDDLPFR